MIEKRKKNEKVDKISEINKIPILEISQALNNKNKVIPIIAIPINTLTAELMLCFTTSVSFFASILGYFKFTIIPIVSNFQNI